MDCCKAGYKWDGQPTGTIDKVAGVDTYIAGDSKELAILIVHDIWGWESRNSRILADQYASEIPATVFLPNFFADDALPATFADDAEKRASLDIGGYLGRNGKDVRFPDMLKVAKQLRADGFKKVGAIGFCYGGLGSRGNKLVDFISTAHPTWLTKEEIDDVAVPVQILAPEHDPLFTEELKSYTKAALPKSGLEYEYIDFPGLSHGFAVRGDRNNVLQKEGLEKAMCDFIDFAKRQSKRQSKV